MKGPITPFQPTTASVQPETRVGARRWDMRSEGIEPAEEENMGKGILLWLVGVPIPVIIVLGFVLHWW